MELFYKWTTLIQALKYFWIIPGGIHLLQKQITLPKSTSIPIDTKYLTYLLPALSAKKIPTPDRLRLRRFNGSRTAEFAWSEVQVKHGLHNGESYEYVGAETFVPQLVDAPYIQVL